MQVRRVLTGHDANGKAVYVGDEMVEAVTSALMPGSEFHNPWGSDATPDLPDDGSRPEASRYFGPVGGFRFGFFTIPPAGVEPDEPGMPTIATIDDGTVLTSSFPDDGRGPAARVWRAPLADAW